MIPIIHALLFASVVYASSTPEITPVSTTTNEYAKQRTYEVFADTPVLIDIAKCESTYQQFDEKGNVLRGRVDNQDVGTMQINERYHLEEAEKLGLNIYTVEGNLAFAKILYEKEGTKPWNPSKPCWGK